MIVVVSVYFQLTKTRSKGAVTKVKRGFYGFKTKPGKAAKVLIRLVKASFTNHFNFFNLQIGSVINPRVHSLKWVSGVLVQCVKREPKGDLFLQPETFSSIR